ncbi:hypothetical protein CYLTODRAFT_423519 [Cylindrobasidium torrendii FP15055 ss-10]|uniref:Uncharacterized protein n=1 Tax=Cylindrobasidium torrendii FP15055 ss-10 TaxID=1314674 RepID=A0A0D7B738_9AGAR|nr:hypothetical protein CYLTODRAFT_423519 [Cylindrobasidium torrendii FP15055 ss-10]
MANRRLSLHSSALTDDEYDQYSVILNDLCPDGEDVLSVRETRAWLRGRYPDSPVDDILKLFTPAMKVTDTITIGQFYAAMRLLAYAHDGHGVDRSLAFTQPHTLHLRSRTTSPTPGPMQTPPTPPKSATNPFAPHRSTNPFASLSRPTSPTPVTRRPFSPPLPSPKPPVHPASRPLLQKSATTAPLPPPRPGSTSPSRRDAPTLPPRRASQSILPAPPPPRRPPVPPPKPKTHTTPLMLQSLQASKTGHAMKQAEQSLGKTRVMEVLKSSSTPHNGTMPSSRMSSASSSGSSSSSRGRGLPSPPMSATSMEQVALAGKPAPPPPRHPALSEDGAATPTKKPPRHPALSEDGSQQSQPPFSPSRAHGTLGRSRSVHHQPTAKSASSSASGPTPPPMAGRRRPESVQVLMGEMNSDLKEFGAGLSRQTSAGLQRHTSIGPGLQKRLGRLMRANGEDREGLMSGGKGEWAARGQYDWEDDVATPTERDNLKWPVEEAEGWKRL